MASWLFSSLWELSLPTEVNAIHYIVTAVISAALTLAICQCMNGRGRERDLAAKLEITKKKIRKRDRVLLYGKKIVRKFDPLRERAGTGLSRLRLLQSTKETPEQLLHQEPPDELLQADFMEYDTQIPSEVLYLLKSVKVFGHFEKPLFIELCKHMETKFVPAGAILFRPGQPDDSIFVVQTGKLEIFTIEEDGTELPLKEAHQGESIHSMLSILDAVIGRTRPFNTVAARAIRDTYVLQLRAAAFKNFFENNPDSLLRMVQIIMLRLQRVTFMSLSKFFALYDELLNQRLPKKKQLSVYKVQRKWRKSSTIDLTATAGSTSKEEISSVAMPSHASKESYSTSSVDSTGTLVELVGDKAALLPTTTDESAGEECLVEKTPPNKQFVYPCGGGGGGSKQQHHVRWGPSEESEEDLSSSNPYIKTSPEFDAVISQARVESTNSSTPATVKQSSRSSSRGHHTVMSGAYSQFSKMDSDEVYAAAIQDLQEIFSLKDEAFLKERIHLMEVAPNTILVKEGEMDACLYFVASGRLSVNKMTQTHNEVILHYASPGEVTGVLSAVTGEPSFFSIRSTTYCHLICITKANLYKIMSHAPRAICGPAYDLVQRISPLVRELDFGLDWMELEAGRALYSQGDEANCAYIVLQGRLRSVVRKSDGKKEMLEELGRGEAVGVVEAMTSEKRTTTVHAVRDTELAQLPVGLLNTLKLKQPQVVSRMIDIMGEKILSGYTKMSSSNPLSTVTSSNLSTVAVVPVTGDVPISHLTRELCSAIIAIAPALRLTSSFVQECLGSQALESVYEYRLRTWLAHQEDKHSIVLYQADPKLTAWTSRCIRQADCILLVALAEHGPTTGQILKQVESISGRVQKELLLLHRSGVMHPTGTVKWLNKIGWLSSHFHIHCPDYFFQQKLSAKEEKTLPRTPCRHSDFARLARKLMACSIGVVLGGGGARGLSHIGILKAIREAGIPIDMVGGTSIGSLVGALYAEELDINRVETRAKEWAKAMSGRVDKVFDLTYPHTSMFTGKSFNNCIHNLFKEKQVEDLWIPYYCVTTDITDSKIRIHKAGTLWRYVRASMSLSGYLPPLCDPVDGHLLLDGGYVSVLPADVMVTQGVRTIVAIDVSSEDNNNLMDYGDHISGWWLLLKRFFPFGPKIRVPNLSEIQSRLAYTTSTRQLTAIKSSGLCEYIRPPIDHVGTLQFGRYEETVSIGYKHGLTVIRAWRQREDMKHMFTEVEKTERDYTNQQDQAFILDPLIASSRSSVRNLAALASQLRRNSLSVTNITARSNSQKTVKDKDESSSDEELVNYWSDPEDSAFNDNQSDVTAKDQNDSHFKPKFALWSDSELFTNH